VLDSTKRPTPVNREIEIDGRELAHFTSKASPTRRALTALELRGSHLLLKLPTHQQALALTGASHAYLWRLERATDEEREEVRRGRRSITSLRARPKRLTDEELKQICRHAGIPRVLALLCEIEQGAAHA
jgi:hypothetical protein